MSKKSELEFKHVANCGVCGSPIITYSKEDEDPKLVYTCKCNDKPVTIPYYVPYMIPVYPMYYNPYPVFNPYYTGAPTGPFFTSDNQYIITSGTTSCSTECII